MTRILLGTMLCLMLAACGGGRSDNRNKGYNTTVAPAFAAGQVARACMSSGRKAANVQLCGCVQAVADRDLRGGDQSMAASFFSDPHRAQEIRQSDNPHHEEFWKRYKVFAERAEQTCTGL